MVLRFISTGLKGGESRYDGCQPEALATPSMQPLSWDLYPIKDDIRELLIRKSISLFLSFCRCSP